MKRIVGCCAVLVALGSMPAVAGDVHVGINIGVPPPPVVVGPPPALVAVPTTPAVSYAPDVAVNLFFYGGHYYTFEHGAWFVAPTYGAPWTYVERVHVPRPVLVVPTRYYKVPPGHWKKMYGDRRGKHRGRDHGHGRHH